MAYGLKWFTEWCKKDEYTGVEMEWLAEIHELDYAGATTRLDATDSPCTIDFGEASDKTKNIKGSKATVSVYTSDTFDLETIYTDNERKYLGIIKLNTNVVFRGFLDPSGLTQDWIDKRSVMTLDFVDGLALLKNLTYAQENGDLYIGIHTPNDIIRHCLNRLQIPDMHFATRSEWYEEDTPAGPLTDPLTGINFLAENYFLSGQPTPLSCFDVLDNILKLFFLDIRQSGGMWRICQMDLFAVEDSEASEYEVETGGIVQVLVDEDITLNLGGIIQSPDIIHTGRDQTKRLDKAYKGQVIRYKFSNASALNNNFNLNYNGFDWDYWTFASATILPVAPVDNRGIQIQCNTDADTASMTSDPVPFASNEVLKFVFEFKNNNFALSGKIQIKLTSGILTYWLDNNGDWFSSVQTLTFDNFHTLSSWDGTTATPRVIANDGIQIGEVTTDPLPSSGDIEIILLETDDFDPSPMFQFGTVTYLTAKIELGETTTNNNPEKGQLYIAKNVTGFSYTPPVIDVLNGDDQSTKYTGTIYKLDGSTPSTSWFRKGITEQRPLLSLLAETYVKMYALNYRIYEGSIYGYFPPYTRFTIEDWPGVYMLSAYNYDCGSNIGRATIIQVSNADVTGAPDTVIDVSYDDSYEPIL